MKLVEKAQSGCQQSMTDLILESQDIIRAKAYLAKIDPDDFA